MNSIKLSIERLLKHKFFKFLLIGGFCTLQNLVYLYFLTTILGINYLISTIFLMITVNSLGFYLNRKYTFAKKTQTTSFLKALLKYHYVMLFSSITVLCLMYLLVEICKIWYLYANIIITICMTIFNFFIHNKWTFK
jgi:putative flippase GtrA